MMKTYTFQNGSQHAITINEEMLSDEAAARQRAVAEFVRSGVQSKTVRFETYRTDLRVGETVVIRSRPCLVTEIEIRDDHVGFVSIVEGVHYGFF